MNFKQASHIVLDLCIELQAQGKFIEPEFDIKRNEIDLWFYDGFIDEILSTNQLIHWKYFENPTEQGLADGDTQGNFETCIQFLRGLLEPVNEFKGMDLNEINNTINTP